MENVANLEQQSDNRIGREEDIMVDRAENKSGSIWLLCVSDLLDLGEWAIALHGRVLVPV